MIRGYIRGQSFRLVYPTMVSDTIAYREAEFFFETEDWEGLVKWVHFSQGDVVYDVKLTDNRISKGDNLDLSEGEWQVYLHGNTIVDGTVVERITTATQTLKVLKSGVLDGEPLPVVTPTASEQIAATAEQALRIAQSVRDDADGGAFKGDKGDRGEPTEVMQETGDSETAVMSQKATTEALEKRILMDTSRPQTVYAVDNEKKPFMRRYSPSAEAYALIQRDANKRAKIEDPEDEFDIANKRYVENTVNEAIEGALSDIPDIIDLTSLFYNGLLSAADLYDDGLVVERLYESNSNTTMAIVHHMLKDKAHMPFIKIPSVDPKIFRLCHVLYVTYGGERDADIIVDFSERNLLRITECFYWEDGEIVYYDANSYELIDKSAHAKASANVYTDERVGDIETALDGILAIQEALIGGESA